MRELSWGKERRHLFGVLMFSELAAQGFITFGMSAAGIWGLKMAPFRSHLCDEKKNTRNRI